MKKIARKEKYANSWTGSSRRGFLRNSGLATAGLMLGSAASGAAARRYLNTSLAAEGPVADLMRPASHAVIKGFIGKRLDLSYRNRILAQDVDALVAPFSHRTETHLWQTEFWGKWFDSAVEAYRYNKTPALAEKLDKAVKGLIATQTPDGYIGNYAQAHRLEQWDIWGMKYCLFGLLDYYDLTGHQDSLDASVKLADYLIGVIRAGNGLIVDKGNYRGMAASSILGPMVRLYLRTKNRKYLDFSEEIVKQWETPGGPQLISKSKVDVSERFAKPKNWYSWEQGQKAYEMMSCYEGLLDLYRVTGKKSYLDAVEDTWNNILDTEINVAGSGASAEMWFGGKKRQTSPVLHYQETCVTVTWISLTRSLFMLTGAARYAHEIEKSYYNALMGSWNSEGATWAKYTPLNGERLPGSGQCGMELNCCVANGPRGQFHFPELAVTTTMNGAAVNFFSEGSYEWKTPGGKTAVLNQQTDYPVSGNAGFHLKLEASETMALDIRIPTWSKRPVLKVNGEAVRDLVPGNYASIRRKWSSGDSITLALDMEGRVENMGEEHRCAAILWGPLVLARDARLPGPPLATVHMPVTETNGTISLTPSAKPHPDVWMQFDAKFLPESYSESGPKPVTIPLCDYASAGNGPETSAFQVWMPQIYDPRNA